MSDLSIKEIEGIEFYVSEDGKQTGVSISGLARLCGVTQQTISQRILQPLKTPTAKLPSKSLEALRDKGIDPQLKHTTFNNYKLCVVSHEVAAVIITYYAFESKNQTEEAKYSLSKFAAIGMDRWIKEVVGFSEAEAHAQLVGLMQELMSEVKELKADVQELRDFKKATVTLPGLQAQFEMYAKQEAALNSPPFTLDEWLQSKGIHLSHGTKCSLGRMIADLYKVNRQAFPEKARAYDVNRKGGGLVTVYRASDIPMLQTALQKVLAG